MRYRPLSARLAGLLLLALLAATPSIHGDPPTIPPSASRTDLEAQARRCYGLLADEGLRAAQALATRIERGVLSHGFTARDVRRNGWRYLSSDAAVRGALDWLEDEGWLRSAATPMEMAGGRPTVRYWINPKITKGAGCPTAKTDETLVSAVMAAPYPDVSENLKGAAHG